MSTKILIIEDSKLTANNIKFILESQGYDITEIIASGDNALNVVSENVPDLIIVDIKLSGFIDGITTAKNITRHYSIPIIFLTKIQNGDTFKSALDANPHSYLTKPFSDTSLIQAVELALNSAKKLSLPNNHISPQVDDGIFLPSAGSSVKIFFKDILYIKSQKVYSQVFVEKDDVATPYLVSKSSNHVVEQLRLPQILKVHKSFYVNVWKIQEVRRTTIVIKGVEIPIAKENIQALKQHLTFLKF